MTAIPHVKFAFGDLAEKIAAGSSEITVPREVLARLLDLYISCWDFDEEWYVATNPAGRTAIDAGQFQSGWAHFRAVGYFEGRLGAQPTVDAEWYMKVYPDVAKAVMDGRVVNVLDHYLKFG